MASSLYKYSFTTRLHDIDAAGVVFFARIFYYAHDAYESFLSHHQQSIQKILQADFILPVSHTEADFKAPMFLNEEITIDIFSQDVRDNEFTLYYHFLDQSGQVKATALTQHVCLDTNTRTRKALPKSIRSIL